LKIVDHSQKQKQGGRGKKGVERGNSCKGKGGGGRSQCLDVRKTACQMLREELLSGEGGVRSNDGEGRSFRDAPRGLWGT